MKRALPFLSVLGFCLALSGSAHARECGGITLPDSATVGGARLVLNGMGIREATVFNVDVYVAGLYVEARSRNGNEIANSDTRRRLVLRFVREVERNDIADAFRDGFRRNAGGSMGALQPRLNRLLGWMSAVREGSSMQFTYIPGTGLQVAVNGTNKGTIEGADFAKVFYGIWLGANPPNPGLRRGLLGGQCG